MKRTTLCILLGLGVALLGLVLMLCFLILPWLVILPELTSNPLPTVCCFLCNAMVPAVAVAVAAFIKLCRNIAQDRSFSESSAKSMGRIGLCSAVDTLLVLIIYVLWACFSGFEPLEFFFAAVIMAAGFTIAMAALLLRRLIEKASSLEEEVNLTV